MGVLSLSDPESHLGQPPAHVAMQATGAVSTFVGRRSAVSSVLGSPLSPEFLYLESPSALSTRIRPRSHGSREAPDPRPGLRLHSLSPEITDKARGQTVDLEGATGTVHHRQRAEVLIPTNVGHLCQMADEATHQTMMGTRDPEDDSQNQRPVAVNRYRYSKSPKAGRMSTKAARHHFAH